MEVGEEYREPWVYWGENPSGYRLIDPIKDSKTMKCIDKKVLDD